MWDTNTTLISYRMPTYYSLSINFLLKTEQTDWYWAKTTDALKAKSQRSSQQPVPMGGGRCTIAGVYHGIYQQLSQAECINQICWCVVRRVLTALGRWWVDHSDLIGWTLSTDFERVPGPEGLWLTGPFIVLLRILLGWALRRCDPPTLR